MKRYPSIGSTPPRRLRRLSAVAAVAALAAALMAAAGVASPHHSQVRRNLKLTAHGQRIHPVKLHPNQSTNWSGYNQGTLEQGSKLFHAITANWTVPTVSPHVKGQAEYSSDWIGIGGGCVDAGCTVTDPTLIQTGTEQDVSAKGATSYSAWYELIPAPSLTITSLPVHAGDRMYASIAEAVANSNVWTITIKDLTDKKSFSTTVPYSSTHATAEWIEETPLIIGTNGGFAALPNATSPRFENATTNGAAANLKSSEEMQLINSAGHVIADPSAPDSNRDGFNICAWASACAAPTTT